MRGIIYHYSITQISSLRIPSSVTTTLSGIPIVEITLIETHRQEVLLIVIKSWESEPKRSGDPEETPRSHVSSNLQPAVCPSQLSLSCHGPKFMINCLRHLTGN